MKKASGNIRQKLNLIPSSVYLWTGIIIFAASSSVTRKIMEIGREHLVNGRNPISLCNVLLVGNICAFLVMTLIFYREWQLPTIKRFTRTDWLNLTIVAILSGALGPGFIFAALDNTNVTNVVLISRLEPPLTLALNVLFLGERVNRWTVIGSLVCLIGVGITAFLGGSGEIIMLGKGEFLAASGAIVLAVATVVGKSRLQGISLGIFSMFRNFVGTIIFFLLANYIYGSQHFAEAFSSFLWFWMFIYGVVIVVGGQLCWLTGFKGSSSAEVALASSFNPIAAIMIAYLILGELPTGSQYLGGGIIMLGIFLGLIGNLSQKKMVVGTVMSESTYLMGMATGFRGV